ncbi:hypothetical protein OZX57_05400 [Bifidobacterium sp. ESL0682]|uniref:hypothetical protein n=1 Tax=Bifidobacterium sp. ESL0682 TaxID=2983212 RepID=UPI0023F6A243|nr:hypothetical protein [Bifidobacterium sp. ESL0682]WEV41471.1 hypothetical protein OZX57_05400 [Bifidobacterium sp. ESL0682]
MQNNVENNTEPPAPSSAPSAMNPDSSAAAPDASKAPANSESAGNGGKATAKGDRAGNSRRNSSGQPSKPNQHGSNPNRSTSSKGKKRGPSSWTVLGHDLVSWMRGHLFAIVVAALFLVINIVDMVFSAMRHMHVPANGRNLSLTEILFGRARNGMRPHNPFHQTLHSQDIIPWLTQIFRSSVIVRSPLMLIIYTLLIVIILSVAQSKLGAWNDDIRRPLQRRHRFHDWSACLHAGRYGDARLAKHGTSAGTAFPTDHYHRRLDG